MRSRITDWRRLLLAIVVTAIVGVPALWPGTGAPGGSDLLLHALAGSLLTWTYALVQQSRTDGDGLRVLLVALVAAVLVGLGIEVLQGFVPGRHPALGDALAHAGGAGFAVLVWLVLRNRG